MPRQSGDFGPKAGTSIRTAKCVTGGDAVTAQQARPETHWRAMVRSARGVLGCPSEAEECAAQALLQVCQQDISRVDNLEAYMVTVANRRAIDRLRHLDRARRRDQLLATHEAAVINDHADDVARRSEAFWMAAQARTLLDGRSYDVLARYAEGEDMSSIAASHGISEGAARTVLHRARKLMRGVHAKTLALLALLWTLGRRASAPVPAVALATAVSCLLLPNVGNHVGPTRPNAAPTLETSALVVALPIEPEMVRVATEFGDLGLERHAYEPRAAATTGHRERKATVIRAPLKSGVVIEKERRGGSQQSDPVAVVTDCLNNFKLSMQHIGC